MSAEQDASCSLERMRRVRVVLVRPQAAGNIGSVARVMENLGAGELYLVQPRADPASREAVDRSTQGEHRLRSARIVPTLREALEGVVYAVAATRRRGPIHQPEALLPRTMAHLACERLAEGDVALLFGPEDKGLSREDLLACDASVQIPAQPGYPTFNLAHAVVICLYEVFVALASEQPPAAPDPSRRSEPADLALMNRLVAKLQDALLKIGYLHRQKPDHLMFPIRGVLARARLTRTEAQILIGLAQQIDEFSRRGK